MRLGQDTGTWQPFAVTGREVSLPIDMGTFMLVIDRVHEVVMLCEVPEGKDG